MQRFATSTKAVNLIAWFKMPCPLFSYIYLEHQKLGNSKFTDTLTHLILYSKHRKIRDECINQYPRSTDQFLEGIQTGESGAITATISKGLDAQTEEFAKICKTLIETGNADLLKPQFFKVKTDYEKAVEISRIQSSNSRIVDSQRKI